MGRGLEYPGEKCPDKDCREGDATKQFKVDDVKEFKSVHESDLTENIEDDDELWRCIYCETAYTYVDDPSTNGRKPKIIWKPDRPLQK